MHSLGACYFSLNSRIQFRTYGDLYKHTHAWRAWHGGPGSGGRALHTWASGRQLRGGGTQEVAADHGYWLRLRDTRTWSYGGGRRPTEDQSEGLSLSECEQQRLAIPLPLSRPARLATELHTPQSTPATTARRPDTARVEVGGATRCLYYRYRYRQRVAATREGSTSPLSRFLPKDDRPVSRM